MPTRGHEVRAPIGVHRLERYVSSCREVTVWSCFIEEGPDPGDALDGVAREAPVLGPSGREPKTARGVACARRPFDRRAHVVELMVDPWKPPSGAAALDLGDGPLDEVDE